MSGTFNEIDVPPTLVSFAVDVAKEGDIITPEFKKAGNPVYLFTMEKDAYDLPVYAQVMKTVRYRSYADLRVVRLQRHTRLTERESCLR